MEAVLKFLLMRTPSEWRERAVANLEVLLLDHASLELRAAQQAQKLIRRYSGDPGGTIPDGTVKMELLQKMSRLAREELRHFEQVLAILERRGISYRPIRSSGYAAALHAHVRSSEPERLIDTLIVGALIEARSCERFYSIIPALESGEAELANFYASLLRSEARHFTDYLSLAERIGGTHTHTRVDALRAAEAPLMHVDSRELRFHSGIPSAVGAKEVISSP